MLYRSPTTITALILLASALVSCTTASDSMLLGGAIGATAGGLFGNQSSDHDPQRTGIGAAVGAATGALLGYLSHKEERRKQEDLRLKQSLLQGKPQYPSVSAPEVRAVWVPAKIEGDTYIGPHFVYKIEKPAAFKQE